jgi:hypothetical protein
MWIVWTLASLALIVVPLVDAFETILQSRRITHRYRLARFFYRATWNAWRGVALRVPAGKKREAFLSVFAPLSLLGLFATWVTVLILGFGLLHMSIGTRLHMPEKSTTICTYLYLSGTTFFTLGYGDVTPLSSMGRVLSVIESGLGFGFLAMLIGYLPVLFQAYSRREVAISLLDARAGSPPTAAQALYRLGKSGNVDAVDSFLKEWELWAAELLESHLSFPVLSYYRSQHDNQSWLAALTTILDICALLIAEVKFSNRYQAQLTFAMARHAAVDLALILKAPPLQLQEDRLPENLREQMGQLLKGAGLEVPNPEKANAKLKELRGMYEPFVNALARRVLLIVPPIFVPGSAIDNWQRSAGMKYTPGIGSLYETQINDDHFD